MRNRSPANRAASSPPVPARTSRMAEAFSSRSLGASSRATSRSRAGRRASSAASSSRASTPISASPDPAISSSSGRSARRRASPATASATGRSSACSLDRRTISGPSEAADIRASTSWKRSSTAFSLAWADAWRRDMERGRREVKPAAFCGPPTCHARHRLSTSRSWPPAYCGSGRHCPARTASSVSPASATALRNCVSS